MRMVNDKKISKLKALPACWYGICVDFGDGFTDLDSAVDKIHFLINIATGLSGLVAVGLLVYGGFLFITAAGDPEGIEKATKTVTNAVIGLVIVFIANLIVRFVIDEVLGA